MPRTDPSVSHRLHAQIAAAPRIRLPLTGRDRFRGSVGRLSVLAGVSGLAAILSASQCPSDGTLANGGPGVLEGQWGVTLRVRAVSGGGEPFGSPVGSVSSEIWTFAAAGTQTGFTAVGGALPGVITGTTSFTTAGFVFQGEGAVDPAGTRYTVRIDGTTQGTGVMSGTRRIASYPQGSGSAGAIETATFQAVRQ